MSDLKKGTQHGTGRTAWTGHPSDGERENDRGADFGTREPATAGTDRDADETGTSINQGHGHPRDERKK
jgi:hypothetical protein